MKGVFYYERDIIMEVLSHIAEQERLTIRKRQREDIDIAKSKGNHLGRSAVSYPVKGKEITARQSWE